MPELKPNDHVTVFVDGLLVHARVSGIEVGKTGLTIVRYGVSGNVDMEPIKLEEEGLKWARGHVNEKHPAGAALLVAGSLNMKVRRSIPLQDAEERFIKGDMTEAEFDLNLTLWDQDFENGYHD